MVLLLIPVLFLVAGLVTLLEEDAALHAVMEDELVNDTLGLELALLPGELGDVSCLWYR